MILINTKVELQFNDLKYILIELSFRKGNGKNQNCNSMT